MINYHTSGRYFEGWGVSTTKGGRVAADNSHAQRLNRKALAMACREVSRRFGAIDVTFVLYRPEDFVQESDHAAWEIFKKAIEKEKGKPTPGLTLGLYKFVFGTRMKGRLLYIEENVLDDVKATWRGCFVDLLLAEKLLTAETHKLAKELIGEG